MNISTRKSIKILRRIHSSVFANNRISKQTGSLKGGTPENRGEYGSMTLCGQIPQLRSPHIFSLTSFFRQSASSTATKGVIF